MATGVSAMALAFSGGAFWLAWKDDRGDAQWRTDQQESAADQIELLEAVRDELRAQPTTPDTSHLLRALLGELRGRPTPIDAAPLDTVTD